MKTDEELLELAAKAAGFDFRWELGFPETDGEPTVFDEEGFGQYWNPLTDDGDALRLAVKLRLFERASHCREFESALNSEDEYAATRLAIVRASASIGESLKEENDGDV